MGDAPAGPGPGPLGLGFPVYGYYTGKLGRFRR